MTPKPTGERPARGETTGPFSALHTLVGQRMKYIVCVCGRPFLKPALEVTPSPSRRPVTRNLWVYITPYVKQCETALLLQSW